MPTDTKSEYTLAELVQEVRQKYGKAGRDLAYAKIPLKMGEGYAANSNVEINKELLGGKDKSELINAKFYQRAVEGQLSEDSGLFIHHQEALAKAFSSLLDRDISVKSIIITKFGDERDFEPWIKVISDETTPSTHWYLISGEMAIGSEDLCNSDLLAAVALLLVEGGTFTFVVDNLYQNTKIQNKEICEEHYLRSFFRLMAICLAIEEDFITLNIPVDSDTIDDVLKLAKDTDRALNGILTIFSKLVAGQSSAEYADLKNLIEFLFNTEENELFNNFIASDQSENANESGNNKNTFNRFVKAYFAGSDIPEIFSDFNNFKQKYCRVHTILKNNFKVLFVDEKKENRAFSLFQELQIRPCFFERATESQFYLLLWEDKNKGKAETSKESTFSHIKLCSRHHSMNSAMQACRQWLKGKEALKIESSLILNGFKRRGVVG